MGMLDGLTSDQSVPTDNGPRLDMATCCECGFTGKVSEFIAELERDGWENPEYLVHLCPKCEDGAADDYFSSDEAIAEYEAATCRDNRRQRGLG